MDVIDVSGQVVILLPSLIERPVGSNPCTQDGFFREPDVEGHVGNFRTDADIGPDAGYLLGGIDG